MNRFCFLEERANKTRANVIVIGGAEFNIGQEIEYWKKLQKLKWKMIGVHGWFVDRSELTLEQLLVYYKECVGKFEAFSHIRKLTKRTENYNENFSQN